LYHSLSYIRVTVVLHCLTGRGPAL